MVQGSRSARQGPPGFLPMELYACTRLFHSVAAVGRSLGSRRIRYEKARIASDRARKRNCKKLKIRQIDCPVGRDAARMFAKLPAEVGGSYASVFRARLMKYRK